MFYNVMIVTLLTDYYVNYILCIVLFRHKIEHRCPEKESQGLAPMTLEGLLENPEKDWKEKL